MNPQKRHAIFARLRAANPQPRTELTYASAFELLVSVILSAQATDKSVNKATAELFRVANTPAAILALEEGGLSKYIKSIGLYNAKAKNIIAMCQMLLERHGEVEAKLMKFVPLEFRRDAHHWLILHGRYICKARRPACPVCIIADLCEYPHKTPA